MNLTTLGKRMALCITMVVLGPGCAETISQKAHHKMDKLPAHGFGELGPIINGVSVMIEGPRNVVVFPDGRVWTGRLRGTRDVMLVKGTHLMSATGVPESIRQTCDALISFEQDRISYFYFRTRTGGHYVRR